MTSVVSGPGTLSYQQQGWYDAAAGQVDEARLRRLVRTLVDVPSPTGEERDAAAAAVGALRAGPAGEHVDAAVQPFGGGGQANAVARLRGTGDGADLLLHAPLDTWTTGSPELDLPWASPVWRGDLEARAIEDGPFITGLGAGNPKGHAACVLAALEAVAAARVPLRGDLLVGLGAGGMPSNSRAGLHPGTGHGAGVWHLLEQGGTPDAAVIAKPGWTAAHEEVGLAWVEVRVQGTHTYVGSRHRIPFRSALADAADVVLALEEWAPRWAAEQSTSLVSPQAVVSAVDSGGTAQLAGTPAVVRVLLDVRLAPGTSGPQAVRAVRAELARLADAHPGLQAQVRLLVSVPGSSTPREHPVVRSAVGAWEAVEGRTHADVTGASGATDANILRLRGVPTVRIGMPKVADPRINHDFTSGMNSVDLREAVRLTRLLVRVAVDLGTRPASEVTTVPTGGQR